MLVEVVCIVTDQTYVLPKQLLSPHAQLPPIAQHLEEGYVTAIQTLEINFVKALDILDTIHATQPLNPYCNALIPAIANIHLEHQTHAARQAAALSTRKLNHVDVMISLLPWVAVDIIQIVEDFQFGPLS